MNLKKTDSGIYYLHDYIPKRDFRYHSVAEVAMSKKIWGYKNGDPDATSDFTHELMQAITEITKRMPGDKIGLVAVPPSKVGKESAVRDSICSITDWYNRGVAKSRYGCNKVIYNYGDLLSRTTNVGTAHKGQRNTYEEQVQSISCARNRLSRYWTTFIILDDVTTLGTSMDACRDILINHGAHAKYIYRMAIAKTK